MNRMAAGENADERVRPVIQSEACQSEHRQRRRLHQSRHPRHRQSEHDEDRHRGGDAVFPEVEKIPGVGEFDALRQEEDDRAGSEARQNGRDRNPPRAR